MSFLKSLITTSSKRGSFRLSAIGRALLISLFALLAACTTQGARDAEMAEQEAARIAAEQEQARVARERALAEAREREEQAAARARLQAQRDAEQARMQAEAEAQAEAERREREAAQRREQERLAAQAAVEAERRAKLQRIASLEQQIAQIQQQTAQDERQVALLQEAIRAAEELLDVLAAEQEKYDNTDEQGNTLEPLDKELIAELEARKDSLIQQINSQ